MSRHWFWTWSLLLATPLALAADVAELAWADLARLTERVDGFAVVRLAPGQPAALALDQGLTADRLRGVRLDDDPPRLAPPATPYPANMTDDFTPGEAPYVADGIEPFRFRHFNCEFNYGGWHNWAMVDYAVAHGFNIVSCYNRQPAACGHLPAGTRFLHWGGFVNWHTWLPEHGLADGRYDLLLGLDLPALMDQVPALAKRPGFDLLMIDLEHGLLSPTRLREQAWYPAGGTAAERAAFEQRYYDGYTRTYTEPVAAARRAGWEEISVYGWQPFGRRFWGVDQVTLDPATDHAWNAYGKAIYEAVDVLNPSVYCFYDHPGNVAYTLANLDLNRRLTATMPTQKPSRPYYWTLLHGGGGGWRWWANQPQPDEDMAAQILFTFFAGSDGFDCWNWSGTGNHHRPAIKAEADLMIGSPFELAAEGGGEPTAFARYDVIHVVSAEADEPVRFHKVLKDRQRERYGVGDVFPVYSLPAEELRPLIRPTSEPVAAMIEAMALAKAVESLLKFGAVEVDVDAGQQFASTLPIVRRVVLGDHHVIASYDPLAARGGEAREVTVEVAGRRLTVPADGTVRLWVVELPAG